MQIGESPLEIVHLTYFTTCLFMIQRNLWAACYIGLKGPMLCVHLSITYRHIRVMSYAVHGHQILQIS